MTDFKAKMHQIRFWLRAQPQTPLGELTAGFGGCFAEGGGAGLGKMRGRGGRGKWSEGKGRAPKLLLNQGPSEPCYATVSASFGI